MTTCFVGPPKLKHETVIFALRKGYFDYEVTFLQKNPESEKAITWVTHKRYSNFEKLYKDLDEEFPRLEKPNLPEKKLLFFACGGEYIADERRDAFQRILRNFLRKPELRDSETFLKFIEAPNKLALHPLTLAQGRVSEPSESQMDLQSRAKSRKEEQLIHSHKVNGKFESIERILDLPFFGLTSQEVMLLVKLAFFLIFLGVLYLSFFAYFNMNLSSLSYSTHMTDQLVNRNDSELMCSLREELVRTTKNKDSSRIGQLLRKTEHIERTSIFEGLNGLFKFGIAFISLCIFTTAFLVFEKSGELKSKHKKSEQAGLRDKSITSSVEFNQVQKENADLDTIESQQLHSGVPEPEKKNALVQEEFTSADSTPPPTNITSNSFSEKEAKPEISAVQAEKGKTGQTILQARESNNSPGIQKRVSLRLVFMLVFALFSIRSGRMVNFINRLQQISQR